MAKRKAINLDKTVEFEPYTRRTFLNPEEESDCSYILCEASQYPGTRTLEVAITLHGGSTTSYIYNEIRGDSKEFINEARQTLQALHTLRDTITQLSVEVEKWIDLQPLEEKPTPKE